MATCPHLTRALSRAALAEREVSRCGARIVGIDGLAGRTRRLTRPQARSGRPGGLDQPATSPAIAALASLGMAPGNRSGSARGKIAKSRCEACVYQTYSLQTTACCAVAFIMAVAGMARKWGAHIA